MPDWSFSQLVLFLAAYSVLGWCFESLFCTIFIDKKLVNRGFLTGPYCPIYGFGAVGVLLVTLPLIDHPVLVYLASLLVTSILEFFTSWLLEKLFDMRWWDYSHCKFNIQGRVCLKNALFFGLMGLGVAYVLHPPVERLIGRMTPETQRVVASGIIALFVMDLLRTLGAIHAISERVHNLRAYLAELERYNEEHTWFDRQDLTGSIARLRELCAQDTGNERAATILHTLDSLTGKRPREWRIVHNTRMRVEGMQLALEGLRDSWEIRLAHDKTRARSWTERAKIQLRDTLTALNPRVQGLNFPKLVTVFAVSGVVGYLMETLYNFVVTGALESRQGMLYGPFNQVYGLGALLVVWLLPSLARRGTRWLFVGGALLGGCVQYLCSLFQELLFGTVSWQFRYLAVDGRASLPHMLFWGALSVICVRGVLPRVSSLIDRIPKRQGVFMAWVLTAVLGVNLLLSGAAVSRWTARQRGESASNGLAAYLDQRFPDEMMEAIYPTMVLVERESA